MTKDILSDLVKDISNMTKSQQKVADYIIKNPMQAAFSTVDQLAISVGTSTTTIVRLALFFNYSGYAEFQKDLQENLQKMMSPSTKLEKNYKNHYSKSSILNEIVEIQMENFNNTLKNFNEEMVSKAEGFISSANHIYIAGRRSCYGVSHYLYYNLNRIFGNCNLLVDEGGELAEKIQRIKAGDVLIVVTLPRYVKQIVSIAKIAKEKNAKIIAITDSYISPLVQYSDIFFRIETKSPDFHNSLISAMFIAEVLISATAVKNPESTRKILAETEEILRELDIHIND
jgi:DNA-binding MurR/RpiR family transcriptional regulator